MYRLYFCISNYLHLFEQTEQKIDLLKRKRVSNSYNDPTKKDFANESSKNYAAISNSHLCNPVVNMLPNILPRSADQKSSSKAAAKSASCVNRNAKAEDLAKIPKDKTKVAVPPNLSATDKEGPVASSRDKPLEFTATEEGKEKERHGIELKEPRNSAASKRPELSNKSAVAVQELPQLRRTRPRLAKTRSAQNMKLMAQILGSKGVSSNCNALKSREKNDSNKNVEKMSLPKIVGTITSSILIEYNLNFHTVCFDCRITRRK